MRAQAIRARCVPTALTGKGISLLARQCQTLPFFTLVERFLRWGDATLPVPLSRSGATHDNALSGGHADIVALACPLGHGTAQGNAVPQQLSAGVGDTRQVIDLPNTSLLNTVQLMQHLTINRVLALMSVARKMVRRGPRGDVLFLQRGRNTAHIYTEHGRKRTNGGALFIQGCHRFGVQFTTAVLVRHLRLTDGVTGCIGCFQCAKQDVTLRRGRLQFQLRDQLHAFTLRKPCDTYRHERKEDGPFLRRLKSDGLLRFYSEKDFNALLSG